MRQKKAITTKNRMKNAMKNANPASGGAAALVP